MLHPRTVWLASLLLLAPGLVHAQTPVQPSELLAQNAPAPAPPAAPAAPAPAAPATPAPAAPAPEAAPQPAPAPEASPQPGDAFGEEVTLTAKTIIYMNGNATWDSAFETLIDAFKQLNTYLERQGLKADGPSMTIYTSTDDTGFSFQAAIP